MLKMAKVKTDPELRQRKSSKLRPAEALAEIIRARNPQLQNIPKRRMPRSPFGIRPSKSLELGWSKIPLVSRVLICGVLLIVLSLTTPFWADVESELMGHTTFGLWHLCIADRCSSIHDNLVQGRDIPLWYMVSQMTFTIGVICVTLAMFVVTSNHQGNIVRLSPTTNSTMVMMLTVGVLQMSTGLYTYVVYFQDVSFLIEDGITEVDYHGSFYAGVAGTFAVLVGALMLFFDEEITSGFRDVSAKTPIPIPSNNILLHSAKQFELNENRCIPDPDQFVPDENQFVPVITNQHAILYGAGTPHYLNPELLSNDGFRKKAT